MYKGKYKRTCEECIQFKVSTVFPNDRTYGRCNTGNTYADSAFGEYGECNGGEKWVPLTVDIGLADEAANKPWWKKLLTD